MTSSHKKPSLLKRLMMSDAGNFGIISAILLPVTLASAGIAMDLTRMVQLRTELQNAADSAAIAAASAMSEKGMSKDDALKLAREFLAAQMANQLSGGGTTPLPEGAENDLKNAAVVSATETPNGSTGKIFDITVTAKYDMAVNGLTSLLGFSKVPLSASSTAQSATESKNALSMYLVLDKSGSMAWITDSLNASRSRCDNYTEAKWPKVAFTTPCYVSKMEALKAAVASLSNQLETADPTQQYVRTAAISYNSGSQTPVAFNWGTSKALAYVNALDAEGGTDSSNAMATAYTRVLATTETDAHKAKNGQDPSRYIIFMTDGDNNYSSADTSTKATCDAARKANVKVYTVAFMAPSGGKKLLEYCATSASDYYSATNAAELVAAFKAIGEKAAASMTRLIN